MKNNRGNDNLNAIRMLGVQAVNQANSGHPGIVLGAAPIMYTLFTKIMNVAPKNPNWFNRDRFILSAGHGSALLYSTLHLAGYKISIEDLKQFRQWGSITPGHPEKNLTPGVEVTTGPLGQGIGMGVGMALAERFLAAKFNRPNFKIIDHYTYVLCGDGDLQEGVTQEAISFAGKQQLSKLILIHDSNAVQLDDFVKQANVENMQKRFAAENWNTILISDGEDVLALEKAFLKAKKSNRPTYIEVKTVIGVGASKQGTSAVHGAPIGNDIHNVKKHFEWFYEDFLVPKQVYDYYHQKVEKRGDAAVQKWDALLKKYQQKFPQEALQFKNACEQKWTIDDQKIQELNARKTQASRISSGTIFKTLMNSNPTMLGGSADLASSTKIEGINGNCSPENPSGQNVMYGVREFGMGAINNGVAAHGGILAAGSGFFVFTDYLKPAIRLAALMELQELFIFTHDSVAVGEDGPTHQPIEQLAMLRTIPNHNLFRPADYAETYASYKLALMDHKRPSSIILTRQDLIEQTHQNVIEEVKKGAYILSPSKIKPVQITLIATGSEVQLAMAVQEKLQANKIGANVVSMPAMHLFDQQNEKYQQKIIDPKTFKVSLEMGTTYGWAKYVGSDGLSFGIDRFGESAPGDKVVHEFGFNPENIYQQIMKKMK